MPDNVYLSNTTQPITTWGGTYVDTDNADLTITTPYYTMPSLAIPPDNKKGGDDMRYLYEVILVNPKNDKFVKSEVVAKSETSAIMKTYNASQFNVDDVPFDDLKTSCKILMEWKKEKSLKKAIETIKKAVE